MDAVVEHPLGSHTVAAAKRAAYVLMKRMDVAIATEGQILRCALKAAEMAGLPEADLAREFRRELLDQELRLEIEERTEPLRTAILGLAFSKSGLQG